MSEETFVRELERYAGEVRPRPLSLDEVRATAHRIRRTRRLLASGAAAALVAAALVVPAVLGGPSPRSAPEAAPAPPEPTPSLVRFDLAAEPGAPPGVLYIRIADDVAITPSGEEHPLPTGTTQLVPYLDGYLALAAGANPLPVKQRLYRLDADFTQVEDLGPVLPAIAAGGDRVAWSKVIAGGVELTVAEGDQLQWVELPDQSYPVAFDGGSVLVHRMSADGDELGWSRLPDDSSELEPLDDFVTVRDASPASGQVVGDTRYDDAAGQPCAGGFGGDTEPWERCRFEVVALSPDGRSVVGYPDVGTPGHARLTVLDASTGQPLIAFEGAGGSVVQSVVWEEDGRLLAVVAQDGTQAVLRLGTDGSVERATDALVLDAMSVAWFLGGPPAL